MDKAEKDWLVAKAATAQAECKKAINEGRDEAARLWLRCANDWREILRDREGGE